MRKIIRQISNEELLTLTDEAEPLILTNEIKKEKDSSVKNIKEKFSPAVRKNGCRKIILILKKFKDLEKMVEYLKET